MAFSQSESEKRSVFPEFGSEKPVVELKSGPKSSNPNQVLSTKTPDKPPSLPGRSRNSDDFSVSLRWSGDRTGEIKSAKRQILSSPRRSEQGFVTLPERFEILGEFFNGLDTAIRLMKSRGCSTTFTNIAPKMECLTNRRFSYGHLAQMKHLFPEAIQIKRVLKHDESTCCMKPDLHVTLDTNAISYDKTKCESKNMALRKMFRSRLTDFFRANPKNEVPEDLLPEPFNPLKTSSALSTTLFDAAEEQQLSVASHLSQSPLNRHSTINPHENTIPASASSEIKFPAASTSIEAEECLSCPEPTILATPVKDMTLTAVLQPDSTPARLMSATPLLQPSKRCITMSPDDDSIGSPNKLVRRPSRSRSLKFDTLEDNAKEGDNIGEKLGADEGKSSNHESDEEALNGEIDDELNEFSDASVSENEDDDILDILPLSLRQSIKEREKAAAEEQSPAISLAKRRRRIFASVPKLFNVIHFLFQSARRTVITKEELLHKIIAGQSNITDKKEVEEQLSVMLELVPEWISETKASSGDLLVRINKMLAADTIRARIEEATKREISTVT